MPVIIVPLGVAGSLPRAVRGGGAEAVRGLLGRGAGAGRAGTSDWVRRAAVQRWWLGGGAGDAHEGASVMNMIGGRL